MLQLKDVNYQANGGQLSILNSINLTVPKDEPSLIVGRSGSGKTTLLEVISGLTRFTSGTIRWNRKIRNIQHRRWLSGMVFQFPERHFLGLTIGQELKLGHRYIPGNRIQQTLEQVGLSKISLHAPPESLSGGQQRRLAIAVQLLRDPQILLLDEPTAGLDWSMRDEVLTLLTDVSQNRVMLIATHEPELFFPLVHQAWRLEKGTVKRLYKL
uniref:Putative ABC transporter, ATP-binding component n=1 Tax=Paulinella micropora TaxID=1928728 RepID=A0A385I1E8_9EUKA|nr:putative ABC transporter, ATP-binding component [Paulinella micropora]AXY63741.1 putative ABC transporter, ATP-binding component [Paulinella micropora]